MRGTLFIVILFLLFVSCGKDESGNTPKLVTKENIQGRIEKGPFLTGSKVTLYELDDQLKQTGKNIFTTETTDDIGSFSFDNKMELSGGFVEIEINGYFFNEYKNNLSDSQIKLNAIADVSGKSKINVNILTHLESKRIKNLVAGGAAFADAKKQAMSELLKCFYINDVFKSPEDISFFDGTNESTALLAISAILLEGKSESVFSQYITMLSDDFAGNGKISNQDLLDEMRYGNQDLNSKGVKSNLVNYYKDKGYTIHIGDVWKYVDHNGDGVLDDEDYVPESTLPEESVYDYEENVKGLFTFINKRALSYFQPIIYLDAVRSDRDKEADMNKQIHSGSNFVSEAFIHCYQTIHYCNSLINGLEDGSVSYDPKPYIVKAKVLRALMYVDMVQHWGGVPLITQPFLDDSNIPRADKEEIFTFLIHDLDGLKDYLPNESYRYDNLRIPASLVDAVLATIALERRLDATAYLENIINSTIYNVENQSVDIYNSLNNETIFGMITEESQPPFSTDFKKGIYHPVIRYTGVLLNYAESLVMKGNTSKAIEIINEVRLAKGLTLLPGGSDVPKGIANTWKDTYGMDYGYFALLKRLGLVDSELGIPAYMQLLPIPQREIDLNPVMTQNPGY